MWVRTNEICSGCGFPTKCHQNRNKLKSACDKSFFTDQINKIGLHSQQKWWKFVLCVQNRLCQIKRYIFLKVSWRILMTISCITYLFLLIYTCHSLFPLSNTLPNLFLFLFPLLRSAVALTPSCSLYPLRLPVLWDWGPKLW